RTRAGLPTPGPLAPTARCALSPSVEGAVGGEESEARQGARHHAPRLPEEPAVCRAEQRQVEEGARDDLDRMWQRGIDEISNEARTRRERRRREEGPSSLSAVEQHAAEEALGRGDVRADIIGEGAEIPRQRREAHFIA